MLPYTQGSNSVKTLKPTVSPHRYVCAAVLDKHLEVDLPVEKRLEWIFSSSDAHENKTENLR